MGLVVQAALARDLADQSVGADQQLAHRLQRPVPTLKLRIV